jgi:hypothetical protein
LRQAEFLAPAGLDFNLITSDTQVDRMRLKKNIYFYIIFTLRRRQGFGGQAPDIEKKRSPRKARKTQKSNNCHRGHRGHREYFNAKDAIDARDAINCKMYIVKWNHRLNISPRRHEATRRIGFLPRKTRKSQK